MGAINDLRVMFWLHGGGGGETSFRSLKSAKRWLEGRGYTVESDNPRAFRYFDADGVEIGGYTLGS